MFRLRFRRAVHHAPRLTGGTGRGAPAVDCATRAWIRASVGVSRRGSPPSADVVVPYGGQRCDGEALMGFVPRGAVGDQPGAGCGTGLITRTAVTSSDTSSGSPLETRRVRDDPDLRGSGRVRTLVPACARQRRRASHTQSSLRSTRLSMTSTPPSGARSHAEAT